MRPRSRTMVIALAGVSLAVVLPVVTTVLADDLTRAQPAVSLPPVAVRSSRAAPTTPPPVPRQPTPSTLASSSPSLPVSTVRSRPTRTAAQHDTRPPTPVGRLRLVSNTATTVTIAWDASVDNVAVAEYLVSLNGALTATTQQTSIRLNAIPRGTRVLVQVAAVDQARNQAEWRGLVLVPALRTTSPSSRPSPTDPAPPTGPHQTHPEPEPTAPSSASPSLATSAPQTGEATSTMVPTVTLSPPIQAPSEPA